MVSLVVLGACSVPLHASAAPCIAKSPPQASALVELYTSEGCSSCPPADRWLSGLGKAHAMSGAVVPIALHVDYWDYIGWKDPYARRVFSLRQRELAALGGAALVYTPQVRLQGRDFRAWGSQAFDAEVARINAQPARAEISLVVAPPRDDALAVHVAARLLDPAERGSAALYLATYENKLVSKVAAGENRGRTLRHDFVALDWVGPIDFDEDGRVLAQRRLNLVPKSVAADSGVIAFVQNRRTAAVLQALMLPSCPG